MTISIRDDLPTHAKGDSVKFQQILLNLILQSLVGTYRGFLKIKAEYIFFLQKPYLSIAIENSKFELHKKDNLRIHKLT